MTGAKIGSEENLFDLLDLLPVQCLFITCNPLPSPTTCFISKPYLELRTWIIQWQLPCFPGYNGLQYHKLSLYYSLAWLLPTSWNLECHLHLVICESTQVWNPCFYLCFIMLSKMGDPVTWTGAFFVGFVFFVIML